MNKSPWGDSGDNPGEEFLKRVRKNSSKMNMDFKIPDFTPFSPKTGIAILVAAVALWFATGFYKVDEGEQSVVLRFGAYVRTAGPGLNYHLPAPIETAIVEAVNISRTIEIGYRSNSYSENPKSIQHESTMLTGDENIIDLNCVVMWHIKDLEEYVFNVAHPEEAVKAASESAIREVIGETPISSILSSQKQEIASKIEMLVQDTLDQYKAGIEIEMVQLLKAEPPAEVIDAYRDVQTSKADKERAINQAIAYSNDIIPKARGEAAKILEAAEGYKQETIAKASGDTKRFLSVYTQYLNQKQITKNRMYLDAIEVILKDSKKYIMGSEMLPHMAIGPKEEKR